MSQTHALPDRSSAPHAWRPPRQRLRPNADLAIHSSVGLCVETKWPVRLVRQPAKPAFEGFSDCLAASCQSHSNCRRIREKRWQDGGKLHQLGAPPLCEYPFPEQTRYGVFVGNREGVTSERLNLRLFAPETRRACTVPPPPISESCLQSRRSPVIPMRTLRPRAPADGANFRWRRGPIHCSHPEDAESVAARRRIFAIRRPTPSTAASAAPEFA